MYCLDDKEKQHTTTVVSGSSSLLALISPKSLWTSQNDRRKISLTGMQVFRFFSGAETSYLDQATVSKALVVAYRK